MQTFVVLVVLLVLHPYSGYSDDDAVDSDQSVAPFRFLDNIGTSAPLNLTEVVPVIESTTEVVLLTTYFGALPVLETNITTNITKWCNGGIPQLANITYHQEKARTDLIERIPDPNFSGYVVHDYESWNLIWNVTSSEYQQMSIMLAQYENPSASSEEVLAIAVKDYEAAALKLFLATLQVGYQTRPMAKFGFYGYPQMPFYTPGQTVANQQKWNTQLKPLWCNSTALYPSIYLPYKSGVDTKYENNQAYVVRKIVEAGRCSSMCDDSPEIWPYTWHRYHDGEPSGLQLLIDEDFTLEFTSFCMNLSVDGAILWGSETNTSMIAQTKEYFTKHRNALVAAHSRGGINGSHSGQSRSIPGVLHDESEAETSLRHYAANVMMLDGWTPPSFQRCSL